jgi:hypothetical protein
VLKKIVILFLCSFAGITAGWCNVVPCASRSVVRAGGSPWVAAYDGLDFFGSFCIKTKRTGKNEGRIGTPAGFPAGATAYLYDHNSNTSQEGSTAITYNILNLPQKVQLIGGRTISNTYAYDGRKLKTETKQGKESEKSRVIGNTIVSLYVILTFVVAYLVLRPSSN